MTLNTILYVDGIKAGKHQGRMCGDLLKQVVDILCEVDGREIKTYEVETKLEGTQPDWTTDPAWTRAYSSIHTVPGQGLPAWVFVSFKDDGSMVNPKDLYDDECEMTIEYKSDVEVSMDTAYGYQGRVGGCGRLHAETIKRLRKAVPEGVTFRWVNEFNGEIYDAFDDDALDRY